MLEEDNVAIFKLHNNSFEVSERTEESWRESFHFLKEYINYHYQNVTEIWTLGDTCGGSQK